MFIYIGAKAKVISVPDGFSENPFQRLYRVVTKIKGKNRFRIRFCSV